MPAVQTSYGMQHSAAVAGMRANMEPYTVISRLASAPIAFGTVVVQGATDNQVNPPSAGATAYRGIAVMDITVPPANADGYLANDTIGVATKGVYWVTAGATVAAGAQAYYVPATGVLTSVSTSNTIIPNAFFDSSAASGALVKLRLN